MASISGLGSGLDTASIVNQFMQLEAVPQNRLKNQVGTEKSALTTLQGLNTKLAALQKSAAELAKPAAWSPLTATSSNAAVKVTTGSAASPATTAVTVTTVAKPHVVIFGHAAALAANVTGAGTELALDRFDGEPALKIPTDGTLAGVVRAINDPANNTGLQASTIKVGTDASGTDVYRLVVESKLTGAAQDFGLTVDDGSDTETTVDFLGGHPPTAVPDPNRGMDAAITIAGVSVTSTSNTFADVMPGVTLTLGPDAKAGDASTINVARDTTSLTDKVKALVEQLNSVLTDLDTATAYGSNGTRKGPLAGDAGLRTVRDAIIDSVYPSGGGSLAALGIQVNRSGKLDFDTTKFSQAYAADPVGVAEKFNTDGDGFAARMSTVAKEASNTKDGLVTSAITGRKTGIDRLENSIESWDRRLELRRATLERQFTALETALSQMNSQSSWLSGQLAGLSS